MAIRIVTDSSSDLSAAEQKELDINILPLKVIFDREEYLSGVTISAGEFYEKLSQSPRLPTTSQPSIVDMENMFRPMLENGDDVIAIFISGRMSGTVQNANIVKQELGALGGRLYIIDGETVTFALALLVVEAARMRDSGTSAVMIAEELDRIKKNIRLYAVVDTLKYLQMGGRINGVQAVVGGMLGIKPLITIEDGLVENIGRERGKPRAFQKLHDTICACDIDTSRTKYMGNTNDKGAFGEYKDVLEQAGLEFDFAGFRNCDIGPTVGVHVGPGALGFAFFVK